MGSFYATCSITDLSITDGDQMYMQLIIPTWVKNPHSIDGEQYGCGEKGLRVSNEGAMGEFVPFGFPIAGHYADYGNMDGITKDRNIEMLEEFFNIPIQDIISCATDDRWYKLAYKPVIEDNTKEEYKGQHNSWTVADNKMKNIEILKDLTVTYFKKEHYEYLSESLRGGDDYWMDETKKRFKKIKKSLKRLAQINAEQAKQAKKPQIKLEDITDKQVKMYRDTFGDEKDMTDGEIRLEYFMMLNVSSDSKYKLSRAELDRSFPITSMARVDMYALLPLTEEDADEVIKQYTFIVNMHSLYKVIRPSYYGSQTDNFKMYSDFHKMSVELTGGMIEESVKSEVGFFISEALAKVKTYLMMIKTKSIR